MPKRRTSEICNSAVKRNRVLCRNCRNIIYSRKETSLKCTVCADWIHLRCSALTSADLHDKEKIDAVKCEFCASKEDEEIQNEETMSVGESDNPCLEERMPLLRQILAELKAIKRSMRNLENENSELKISVMSLAEANDRLAKQVAVLQRNANTRNYRNRSESRVRLASDVMQKQASQKQFSSQRNRSLSRSRGYSRQHSHGIDRDPRKSKSLIKRVEHRTNPGTEVSTLSTKPKLPTARTRIQTRKLHISNMCDSVTAEAVYKHVVTHGNVHPLTVKRLRNRTGGYGSRFYVEVLDVDYDKVINDELWENDTVISFYRGPLRTDFVIDSFPKP